MKTKREGTTLEVKKVKSSEVGYMIRVCVDEKTGMFKIMEPGDDCPPGFLKQAFKAALKGTIFPPWGAVRH